MAACQHEGDGKSPPFAPSEHSSFSLSQHLPIDAVQKANSGHPGAPMGLAPVAYVLYTRVMRHNPSDPDWLNRDRFILSAGHASMLLYSMLYLTGYPMTLDDIKLGAKEGIPRQTLELGKRTVEKGLWAAAFALVGGEKITWITGTRQPEGVIGSLGKGGGMEVRKEEYDGGPKVCK
ncbi:hypothetical protein B4Q13_20360 [Lacticaseibacillus rhamnosus]